MSANFVEQYIIVKGYIDARDERQRTIYGTFLAVVSRHDMKYLRVLFGTDSIAKESTLDELHELLERKQGEGRDPVFLRDEAEFEKYMDVSRTLHSLARNRNAKQAEQAISRFCAEVLTLKAVTFVEYTDVDKSLIGHYTQSKETPAPSDGEEENGEETTSAEAAAQGQEGTRSDASDYVVRCDPVLDPVSGVAMTELMVGDYVCAKLPEGSVFFKLLASNMPAFDGVINAQISGVLINELGTATASLELAPGVAGVMKISGKAKIRRGDRPGGKERRSESRFSVSDFPLEIVLGAALALVVVSAMVLIVYLSS